MKRVLFGLCAIATVSVSFVSGWYFGTDREPPPLFDEKVVSPDPSILSAAEKGLEKVRRDREIAFGKSWIVRKDDTRGVIETDWFKEHKGEVRLKVIIKVWGENYHVDVWQQVLTGQVRKTYWSRMIERAVESEISHAITTSRVSSK